MNQTKRKSSSRNRKRLLQYPELYESKTFQIKYEKKLSIVSKFLLHSFQNKHIYHAIDDILDSFQPCSTERDNLLAVLYSPILSLQNNYSIHFFDIWIDEIYINEVSKVNRFLKNDFSNFEEFNYITIRLFYTTRIPTKKQDSLW